MLEIPLLKRIRLGLPDDDDAPVEPNFSLKFFLKNHNGCMEPENCTFHDSSSTCESEEHEPGVTKDRINVLVDYDFDMSDIEPDPIREEVTRNTQEFQGLKKRPLDSIAFGNRERLSILLLAAIDDIEQMEGDPFAPRPILGQDALPRVTPLEESQVKFSPNNCSGSCILSTNALNFQAEKRIEHAVAQIHREPSQCWVSNMTKERHCASVPMNFKRNHVQNPSFDRIYEESNLQFSPNHRSGSNIVSTHTLNMEEERLIYHAAAQMSLDPSQCWNSNPINSEKRHRASVPMNFKQNDFQNPSLARNVEDTATELNEASVSDEEPAAHVAARLESKMRQSVDTMLALQKWDHDNGLPKSHCQTMVNTSRSRKQLLEGVVIKKWDGKPLMTFQGAEKLVKPIKRRSTKSRTRQESIDLDPTVKESSGNHERQFQSKSRRSCTSV